MIDKNILIDCEDRLRWINRQIKYASLRNAIGGLLLFFIINFVPLLISMGLRALIRLPEWVEYVMFFVTYAAFLYLLSTHKRLDDFLKKFTNETKFLRQERRTLEINISVMRLFSKE